jgi:thiol-disulfide isomerase/thioredoxin
MCIGIAALAVCAGACWGQDSAEQVIERVLAHYEGLKGASVTMSLEIDMGDSPMAGMMGDLSQKNMGYAVKPNLFAFWPEKEGSAMMGVPTPVIWADGTQIVSAMPGAGVYSIDESPADFSEIATTGEGMMANAAWQMIPGADMLLQFMAGNAKEKVGEMLGKAEFLGAEGEGAAKTLVFLTSDDTADMEGMRVEIHIAAEGDPWVLAVEPQFEQDDPMMAGMTAVMRFADWKPIDAAPDAGKIEIADDWEKVDNLLMAAMGGMSGMDTGDEPLEMEEPAGPGEGSPAPDFSLATLGGDTFSLADHRGKVVALDFWATWCGPCVRGLPTVSAIMKEYEAKGVVFAAVNLSEEAEHVSGFMKDKGWAFTVPLDGDGEIATQFGVTGIPHSVLIDKKGVIRHVHIGFDPNAVDEYTSQLKSELEALLAE